MGLSSISWASCCLLYSCTNGDCCWYGRSCASVMPWNVAERGENGRVMASAFVSLQNSMTECLRDCGRDSAEKLSHSMSPSSIPENRCLREITGWSVASAGGWKIKPSHIHWRPRGQWHPCHVLTMSWPTLTVHRCWPLTYQHRATDDAAE